MKIKGDLLDLIRKNVSGGEFSEEKIIRIFEIAGDQALEMHRNYKAATRQPSKPELASEQKYRRKRKPSPN